MGLLLTLVYTLSLLFVQPYKRRDVGVLAVGVQVALLGVFFGALNIKLYDDLAELQDVGGLELAARGGNGGHGGPGVERISSRITGFASSAQVRTQGLQPWTSAVL